MFTITSPNTATLEQIQHKIDDKTKPLGALGQLEVIATQLALFSKRTPSLLTNHIYSFLLAITVLRSMG